MQQANETITIINRKYNETTGRDDWNPTVISGVSWYSKMVASVTQSGLKTASVVTVRIPTDADTGGASYVQPTAYKAAESVSGAYTLARGDLIVHGTVTTAQGQSLTPASVTTTNDECFTITSVTDNTSRPNAPHMKVVGA